MTPTTAPILSVRDMVVHLRSNDGAVRAVDRVSFDIRPGETMGLVGESGSGKSITALSLMQLIPAKNIYKTAGSALFRGEDLLSMPESQIRALRGNSVAMIFQEPMTSLNPVLHVGFQIAEPLMRHQGLSRPEAERQAVDLLDRVGIPSAKQRAKEYPHQLSGGMRQRAMIAIAIACKPALLIADEPTTALDVTIQAQILELLDDLKRELNMAVLLITHNFGVVAQTADRTAVMYAGRVVEQAATTRLFDAPQHPYTRGLLAAMPRLGTRAHGVVPRLEEIPGIVPRLSQTRHYCSFASRCSHRFAPCFDEQPAAVSAGEDHQVRCYIRQFQQGSGPWQTEAPA